MVIIKANGSGVKILISRLAAQRWALAAVGGSVDSPSKREKPKARKMPQKRGAYPKSGARIVRWLFPALFDNGGKPRHFQSGVPPKAQAPIEHSQGGIVCRLPL